MDRQPKSMMTPLLAGLTLVSAAILGGCGTHRHSAAGPWDWTPPAVVETGNAGSSDAVMFAPGPQRDTTVFAYADSRGPEYDRRDEALGVREPNPYAGWYAWPVDPRPSLDHSESFYSGRTAERYVYPSTNTHRQHYRYHQSRPSRHSTPSYPQHRRWR